MQNIIGLVALLAVATLLTLSGFQAWRVRNSFLKWGGVGLTAVLTVAVSSISALTIAGMTKQHARSAPIPDLEVEAAPERIARGKALVDGFCSACHSKTGTLTGGLDIGEHFPIPVGSFVASNLTPAPIRVLGECPAPAMRQRWDPDIVPSHRVGVSVRPISRTRRST